MKMRFRFLALALLLICPALANAQLTFTLANPDQSGNQGATLSYIGTLTNTGADAIFLNGDSFTLDSPDMTLDDTPFFNTPLSLDPGGAFTGELFTVMIGANAPVQIAQGTFTIIGGADDTAQSDLATARFSAAAAPEPATMALAGIGLGALGVGGMRRRKTVKQQGV